MSAFEIAMLVLSIVSEGGKAFTAWIDAKEQTGELTPEEAQKLRDEQERIIREERRWKTDTELNQPPSNPPAATDRAGDEAGGGAFTDPGPRE